MELSTQDLLWLELAMRRLIAETEARGDNVELLKELHSRISAQLN